MLCVTVQSAGRPGQSQWDKSIATLLSLAIVGEAFVMSPLCNAKGLGGGTTKGTGRARVVTLRRHGAHVADAHVCCAGCDAPDLKAKRCTKARPKKEPPELLGARVCARARFLDAFFA
jgi:hypothetical protein